MSDESPLKKPVRIWDLPTRLFHWALVVMIIGSWVTGENEELDLHLIFGKCILTLILFRIIWGFVGGQHARFSDFVRPPPEIIRYAMGLFRRQDTEDRGHNPLGGLSVIALLGLTAATASLGLFSNDDILFEGPLAHLVGYDMGKQLTDLHHEAFDLLFIFIILHLCAIVVYAIVFTKDLVSPMVSGNKLMDGEHPPAKGGSPALAAMVLLVAAAVVWGGLALV